jgi:hypothetical protein
LTVGQETVWDRNPTGRIVMYSFSVDVPMPLSMYEQVMKDLRASGTDAPPERLLHVCAATEEGFRITEVWESHEAVDRYGDEVMRSAIAKVAGEEAAAGGPPPNQEFDLRGLQLRGSWVDL